MPTPRRRLPDPDQPETDSLPKLDDVIAELQATGRKVWSIEPSPNPTPNGICCRVTLDGPDGPVVEALAPLPTAPTRPKAATTRGTRASRGGAALLHPDDELDRRLEAAVLTGLAGVGLPSVPRASAIPALDRALVAANRLSGFYRAAVDRVVAVYVQAMKVQTGHWSAEPGRDPTEGLAEWLEGAITQEQRLRAQVALEEQAVERAVRRMVPDDPKLRGRDDIAAVRRGLRYAEVWFLLAMHQVAPLAVAAMLGLRVWPKHVGARMATLLIAHRALVKPWGLLKAAASDLPLDEFPRADYAKVWEELRAQALVAVRQTVKTTLGLRDLLFQAEKATDRPRAGGGRKRHRADIVDSAIYGQIIDTGLKEWEALSWHELEQMARAGLFNHAPQAILRDLIDRMRKRRPEESLSGGVRSDDGVPEAVAEPGVLLRDKALYGLAVNPSRRSLEIVLVPSTPDQELEEERRRHLLKQLEADPRYQKLKAALDAGARNQEDIARHYGVDPRTVRHWITALKKEFSG
jgi:hypothetical protein